MAEPIEAEPAPVAERLLWSTRLLLIMAVIGSALLAVAVLWIATVDLVRFAADLGRYTTEDVEGLRGELVATTVKIVDTYLLAAILVIVAFGLYELFVGRIDARRDGDGSPRLLVARSLEDLKDRIAKLVVLILVIEFSQRALKAEISKPSDLLYLAGGIALVSLAIALPTAVDNLKRSGGGDKP